jgi:TM2 domain-containing membrane protein YozV
MNKSIAIILFSILTTFYCSALSARNYKVFVPQQITINTQADSTFFLHVINQATTDSTGPDKDILYLNTPSKYFLSTDTIPFSKESQKKKKIVAAIFSFPFPFGFMGAHRVMLGCKPWVPVVYVATFGGCFGLLPLIDFCVIVFSKDIGRYENNENVFMWVK